MRKKRSVVSNDYTVFHGQGTATKSHSSSVTSTYNDPVDTVRLSHQLRVEQHCTHPSNTVMSAQLANCADTDSYTEPADTIQPTSPMATNGGRLTSAPIQVISSSKRVPKRSGLPEHQQYFPLNPNTRGPQAVYMATSVSPTSRLGGGGGGGMNLPSHMLETQGEGHYSAVTAPSERRARQLPQQAADYEIPITHSLKPNGQPTPPSSAGHRFLEGSSEGEGHYSAVAAPSERRARQLPQQAADYEIPITHSHLSRPNGQLTPPRGAGHRFLEGSSEDYSFLELEESELGGTQPNEGARNSGLDNPIYMYTDQKQ